MYAVVQWEKVGEVLSDESPEENVPSYEMTEKILGYINTDDKHAAFRAVLQIEDSAHIDMGSYSVIKVDPATVVVEKGQFVANVG